MFRRGGGEEKMRKKRGIFRVEEEEKLGPREERQRERVNSGRYRRRKEQWPIERRGNCLAKAIQHKQENSPRMEAEGGWWTSEVRGGGTVWQSHRSTGWAGRRKVLWSLFLLLLLPPYSCAGLCPVPLLSPLCAPGPPLHR